MRLKVIVSLFVVFIFLLSCKEKNYNAEPSGRTVEVIRKNGVYQLYRNGSPYFIKGASADVHLEEIRKSGGNSIRIYDTGNAQQILDKAQELGLTVTLGLRVAKAITEMDYGNEKEVAAQKERLRKEVLKYKDHPALLMWGVGNEANLYVNPQFTRPGSVITNIQTLLAVNDIAKMIHELDPDHPTTTMLPGIPPRRTTQFLNAFCKEIDILSFNTFMTLQDKVPELVKDRGWKGPYLLSEYGPLGYWKSTYKDQTDWYAIYEKTSTEKATFIRQYYKKNILSDRQNCLGSYVFYWGQKNEFTTTWFSFFLEDGKPTEIVDVMNYLWTNKWPDKSAPHVQPLLLNALHPLQNVYIKAGDKFTTTVNAHDAEQGDLIVEWEILEDDNNRFFNSQFNQDKPRVMGKGEVPLRRKGSRLPGKKKKEGEEAYRLVLTAPEGEGPYRLYMFIRNKYDKVATANASFYVLSMD